MKRNNENRDRGKCRITYNKEYNGRGDRAKRSDRREGLHKENKNNVILEMDSM